MKKKLLVAVSVAVFGLLFSNFAFAQSDQVISAAGNNYVITAKAGGVNYLEGTVTILRKDGKSAALLKTDTIEVGDKVSTGADGKAEILLNPGSYVRLGANTQFEFQSTDLDNLKLKLSAGSAIFEVYADDEFKVTLDLPNNDIELTKSGVYRVDVLADGRERIAVWKGKVIVGDEKTEVTAGNEVYLKGAMATLAKFDRKNKDALDLWSDMRAKEASNINKRLKKAAGLTGSLMDAYNRGGWNMYSTFGVWIFDPFSGRWCFMPFGSGWRSPYGYNYRFDFYDCQLPPVVWTNPNPTNPTNPNPGGGQITPAQAEIREARRQSAQTPTFQRFENNTREERGGGRVNGSSNNSSDTRSDSNSSSNSSSSNNSSSSSSSSNSPSQSSPSPSVPSSSSVPSRTESKDVKID